MRMKGSRSELLAVSLLFCGAMCGVALADEPPRSPAEVYGPAIQPQNKPIFRYSARRQTSATVDGMRYWNQLAVDAAGLDETPVAAGETRIYGEQLGPTRSSRAMAIVHVAMFEAMNSIIGGYQSYIHMPHTDAPASADAALATAAHDALSAMFPSQTPNFDALYQLDMNRIPESQDALKAAGIAVGHAAAAGILALRTNDGSAVADPKLGTQWITSNDPGKWRQDPIGKSPIALGAYWNEVKPFVMLSSTQFMAPPPPALNSPEYTAAFIEAKAYGGDGVNTPTIRTPEQTIVGTWWAYDGTPSLCAPPRLYNELAAKISAASTNAMDMARLFALVNVAMADEAIANWTTKFTYNVWRPVTGIREADAGTGPTGLGDGNPDTHGDPTFHPLGAPASNLTGPNFTPPFPGYPSGHAGFGGALFQIMRRFYGTDRIAFTFVSDEFDGQTMDDTGKIRPLEPRSFDSLSQAEEENGQSRIYLGIHWAFDKVAGIKQGNEVADYVFDHVFLPVAAASGAPVFPQGAPPTLKH